TGHSLGGRKGGSTIVQVQARSVDSWIAELGIDPTTITLVKSDTQGYDGHALRGAAGLLALRRTVWQMELWPRRIEKAGMPLAELYALIRAHLTHSVAGGEPLPTTLLPDALTCFHDPRVRYVDLVLLP